MTMLPATPQRTADNRSLAPTPMIALEITWVVETGIPKCDAVRMIEGHPMSDSRTPIVPNDGEALEAENLHHLHLIGCHRPFRIC